MSRRPLLFALAFAVPVSMSVSGARAQDAIVFADAPSAEIRARWTSRIVEELDAPPIDLDRAARTRVIGAERLTALEVIERLLLRARQALSVLDERDALLALHEAERIAERNFTIPGIAAWYAEVELAIAIAAAQAGADGLSAAALRRSASVDPSRVVLAAEARPEVVARATLARRRAVSGPRGRFELSADAPDAVAFIDDQPIGALPRTVEVSTGAHILRIDAPSRRSFAQRITVFEGDRAPFEVRMNTTDVLRGTERLRRAAREGRLAQIAGSLPVGGASRAWLVFADSPADRAVIVVCEPSGCESPRRVRGAMALSAVSPGGSLRDARRWLSRGGGTEIPIVDPEWWERWYVWLGVGAVVAGAIVGAVFLAQPTGPPPIIIEVDPSRLR